MEIIGGNQLTGGTLVEFVERARDHLVLVSPYTRPWGRLQEALKSASRVRRVRVLLVVRAPRADTCDQPALKELEQAGVQILELTSLHAKLYATQGEIIMSSMNLLKSSATDSWEVGVRVRKQTNPRAYEGLTAQVTDLVRRAQTQLQRGSLEREEAEKRPEVDHLNRLIQGEPASGRRSPAAVPKKRRSASTTSRSPVKATTKARSRKTATAGGFCIRCSEALKLNPERPLCARCYRSWARFGDPDYPEQHCHSCGSAETTSVSRPVCKPCWRRLKRQA